MPKKVIDYSKTIIYKIVCKDLEIKDCYVGQTTNFTVRKRQHKCSCNSVNNKYYNSKRFIFIRDNGGWDNWVMVQVEKYEECKDLKDALQKERYYIETLNAELNNNKNLTKQEWRDTHKEHIKELNKSYRELNPETIKNKDKLYYENNKERIKQRNKEWAENNKHLRKGYYQTYAEKQKLKKNDQINI